MMSKVVLDVSSDGSVLCLVFLTFGFSLLGVIGTNLSEKPCMPLPPGESPVQFFRGEQHSLLLPPGALLGTQRALLAKIYIFVAS